MCGVCQEREVQMKQREHARRAKEREEEEKEDVRRNRGLKEIEEGLRATLGSRDGVSVIAENDNIDDFLDDDDGALEWEDEAGSDAD